ncbi:MAG: YncE family protein [Deltaproteobacteria bacterium]|nr:YncE family protein [Deltaproteobacteria bacterium]
MGIAFTPDGEYAYITMEDTGQVRVYDAETAAYVTSISVVDMPSYIVFTPSGNKAYVIDYQNAQVAVIRTSDNSVLTTLSFSGHSLQDAVVSPDGTKVYISNMESGQIEIIRTSDDTAITPIITTEIKPRGIGISPDGNYLFIGHYMGIDSVVNMLRLSDNTVVSSVFIPSNPRRIAVKENGLRIVVTEHNYDECYAFSVNGETLAFTAVADLNTIPGHSASPVGVAFGEYPNPLPVIKINGLDGPLTLTTSDSVRLTLHMENNGRTDVADWFLAASTPFGIGFWTPSTNWQTAWLPMYQGMLVDVEEFGSPVIPLTGFPIGTYTFIFAVDVNMDGAVSLPYIYWDTVILNVCE